MSISTHHATAGGNVLNISDNVDNVGSRIHLIDTILISGTFMIRHVGEVSTYWDDDVNWDDDDIIHSLCSMVVWDV